MRINTKLLIAVFLLPSLTYAGQGTSKADDKQVLIDTKGGINIRTQDGNYKFSLGGFLQWDIDQFDGLYNDDESGSEAKLRRARLIFRGSMPNNYHYELMTNYNNEKKQVELLNAFIKYSGNKAFDVTVGRFKEPFGMEALTSAKWLSTIERSVIFNKPNPVTAGLFIDAGVMLGKKHKNYTWAVALVDDRIEDTNGKDSYALTGRVTYAPINASRHVVHLGLAYSDRNAEEGTTFTINEPLGVHTANKTELFTTTVDQLTQTGLEFAYLNGPFSVQSEYVFSQGEGDAIGTDIDVDSYYLLWTYTVTGESRAYKKGLFGPVKPQKTSAFELVAKLDHNEANITGANNTEAMTTTVGFNYYLNKHTKLAVNFVRAETENLGTVDKGDAISARFQLGF